MYIQLSLIFIEGKRKSKTAFQKYICLSIVSLKDMVAFHSCPGFCVSGPGLLDSLSVLPFFPCCMFVVDTRHPTTWMEPNDGVGGR